MHARLLFYRPSSLLSWSQDYAFVICLIRPRQTNFYKLGYRRQPKAPVKVSSLHPSDPKCSQSKKFEQQRSCAWIADKFALGQQITLVGLHLWLDTLNRGTLDTLTAFEAMQY